MRKIKWSKRRENGKRQCMYCGGCVASCPTGALELKDNKIIWNKLKCIECRDCVNACPEGMLRLE